jgi:protein-S-isoprenylcysteine O-methyltransferase Ste14
MDQRPKIVPPAWFLMSLLAMPALHFLLPITRLLPAPYSYLLGGLLLAAGLATGGTAFVSFTRAGTPVVPFERSTTLVTGGSYRFTRNPMYLGMVLMLSGVAALLGTLSPWLVVPLFAAVIQTNFIRGEERFLEEIFGESYRAYKTRVRRWL